MVEFDEIKEIMTARAESTRILGEMFTKSPRFADIYFLCRALGEAFQAVEITDEQDELLDGYNDLQDWYEKASDLSPQIIDVKLAEEFDNLFKKANAISADFPPDQIIVDTYDRNGYRCREDLAPSNLAQMLFFISFEAKKCSEETDMEKVIKSARMQAAFVENHIMGLLSDFCSILYERSPAHGVYRYITVILHGYMNYDAAITNYLQFDA